MGVAHICDLCGDTWPMIVAQGFNRRDDEHDFFGQPQERRVYELCSDCWYEIKKKRQEHMKKQEVKGAKKSKSKVSDVSGK